MIPDTLDHTQSEHDHLRCIHTAISDAEKLCTERGVQLTPIRKRTLELIWGNHKAIKAYDLLEKIRFESPSAKPPTIYRALDFLLEQGLIHRVESLNAFIGCHCTGIQHERLFLICSCCQHVEERDAPDVMNQLDHSLRSAGFSPERKTIEIHGLCHSCKTQ
jgi:Fur family transcriptional regulator, zinc uptake regulator